MKRDSKPNFLFILIDDMGWKDVACCGSEFYETPNLDKLAEDGVRFTNAYASCPVCSPTRASILTGKYPARLGLTNYIGGKTKGKLIDAPYIDHLSLGEKTIASALKDAGYRTYHVGKWHLGDEPYYPEKHGFDINIAGCHWGAPRTYFSPYNIPNFADGPNGEYLTDRITDEAIKLIENNGDEPFFMYLSHYAVHIPIQVPQKYIKKYEDKAKKLGLDRQKTFEEDGFFPCEHKKDQRIIRRLIQSDPVYAGMIENLDFNIGKVLKSIEDSGKMENTVIIFTSDNGGLSTAEGSPTCNFPLSEGKGWMYEGGVREPLIIKWHGIIEPNSICDVPVTSTDFYPTMLEMAGLDFLNEQHCDGVSFLPALTGSEMIDRKAIFWHYPHYGNQGGTPSASIRSGNYKLIEFFEDEHLELYNLSEDVSEKNNIANDCADITNMLREMLKEWQDQVSAKIPERNLNYIL